MFCDNFKKYRKLSGMTQEEIAKFLMVTPQAVSKWETGNGAPRYFIACSYCRVVRGIY